jgi:hypothetical protein
MSYIYGVYVNSISTSGANNRSILSASSICISSLAFWRFRSIWGFEDGEWVSDGCVRRRPSVRHFPAAFSHLPCMVRKASGVCACPVGCGDIDSPFTRQPPMCYLYEWVECFVRFGRARKVGSMPCGRQGHIKLRMCYWSRAVHPLRNNYLMYRIEKPVKSPGVPLSPPCTWDG